MPRPLHEWGFDKFGELAIAAPDNTGEKGYNVDPPADYCKVTGEFGFGGTSAAAAQVAGVIALMLSAAKGKLKGNPGEVRSILHRTAKRDYLKDDGTPVSRSFGLKPTSSAKVLLTRRRRSGKQRLSIGRS